ncbi:VirB2 family type IV secretion system major pilin TrwL [Bartonella raoultii]|uniref:VirB2 family type IV secretion system major pilin TrwL n=1 Tax=Bartonella raoultii TaxID=1457020 RepID=A0ABS7I4Y8_9HYPH|nr:VirB2 family type IV secretion system major pilin TrwL [Bartonella raoultii]MBX4335896.1 VirB2 family type IV secretion system major pilin TrwL [Bartonella raoultii]
MKRFSILKSKISHKIRTITTSTLVFFIMHPAYAQAQTGLGGITNVLKEFRTELSAIIPIFAAVLLLCLAIGYAGRYIEKDTFVRWAIGVAVAGSATQIANMLFTQP